MARRMRHHIFTPNEPPWFWKELQRMHERNYKRYMATHRRYRRIRKPVEV